MEDLPSAVIAKAHDAGAAAWITELPGLLADLARVWGLTLGAAFGDATEAYVVEAVCADGSEAALKVHVPGRGGAAAYEITALRAAQGEGCARLLQADEHRGALLLERLGPAMSELGMPQPRRLEILCDLAAAVWRPSDLDLPTGADRAARMAASIERRWEQLGRPCRAGTMRQAVAAARSRQAAHDPRRAVLVHGDVHQWNALSKPEGTKRGKPEGTKRGKPEGTKRGKPEGTERGKPEGTKRGSENGFKLVDPDGLIAEPECDLGTLMREDPAELIAGDPWDRARYLAGRTGTDPQAIWEWGVADRVATGLVLTAIGLQPVAREMLAAADEIVSRS